MLAFSSKKINEIKTMDIDHFYVDKIDEGYSAAYIRQIHNLLRKAFEQAVKWELIKSNPVINARPPIVKNIEKATWSVKEVNRFLSIIKHKSFRIALYTDYFYRDATWGNSSLKMR